MIQEQNEAYVYVLESYYLANNHKYPRGAYEEDAPFYPLVLSIFLPLLDNSPKFKINSLPSTLLGALDFIIPMDGLPRFSIIIGIFVLLTLFILTKMIWNNDIVSLLAVFIASIHPLFNLLFRHGYATFFSVLFVNLILIALFIYFYKRRLTDLVFLFILVGIAPQINFIEYLLFPLILFLIILRFKKTMTGKLLIKHIIIGVASFSLVILPFVFLQLFLPANFGGEIQYPIPVWEYADPENKHLYQEEFKGFDERNPEPIFFCWLSKWHCRQFSFHNIFYKKYAEGFPQVNYFSGGILKYIAYIALGIERPYPTDTDMLDFNIITIIHLLLFIIFIFGLITLFKTNRFVAIVFLLTFILFFLAYTPDFGAKKVWLANAIFNGMIPVIASFFKWVKFSIIS